MKLKTPTASDVQGKKVLVRVDYNVPLEKRGKSWRVADDKRILTSLETINFLLKHNSKIILCSHLGRPKGKRVGKYSLKPLVKHLKHLLADTKVSFSPNTTGEKTQQLADDLKEKEILLLENLRYDPGEETNEAKFAKDLAALADVYINDAFSTAHRKHASMVGVTKYLPAFAGHSFLKEVKALEKLTTKPKRPFVMVIGGAKISDKIEAVQNLANLADAILVGGGTANNFLKAEGINIQKSLVEDKGNSKKKKLNYVEVAEEMIESTRTDKILIDGYIPLPKIIMPIDAAAALSMKSKTSEIIELVNGNDKEAKSRNLMYLDIGPKTIKLFKEVILQAGTIFWNGPMGVFEEEEFEEGTKEIARTIAKSGATTVLGGGDTIAAIRQLGLENRYDYVSAAGGASLEFLSGEKLPGLEALLKNGGKK